MSFFDTIDATIRALNATASPRPAKKQKKSPPSLTIPPASLSVEGGGSVLKTVSVSIPTMRYVRAVSAVSIRTVPSLKSKLLSSAHLCMRSEPNGFTRSVRHHQQTAIVWTECDFGLMESIAAWFRRQNNNIIEVPLQECGPIGSAVIDAHMSGKIPVYTCLSSHVVPFLVEALTEIPDKINRGCVVVANDPYSIEEYPLRRLPRAEVYRISIPSKNQVSRCLFDAAACWKHASRAVDDTVLAYLDSDPRKAIIDYHMDQIVCLSRFSCNTSSKDVVARGPMEQAEAGVWEDDPQGIIDYASCACIGSAGKTRRDDDAFWALVNHSDTLSLADTLGAWRGNALAGCIAGLSLVVTEPFSGTATLSSDKEKVAKAKALSRKSSRALAYMTQLEQRREFNARVKYNEAARGKNQTDAPLGVLVYETLDPTLFSTPLKAFRRLLAVSGVIVCCKPALPLKTPCLGRVLAEHFGISQNATTNYWIRLACSALASSPLGCVTYDVIAKEVSWANQNPIAVEKGQTPLQAAVRDN